MFEEVDMIIDMTSEQMLGALNHLDKELSHLRAGTTLGETDDCQN